MKVARETPLLYDSGYGRGYLEPRNDERRQIIHGPPADERRPAVERWIDSELARRRQEILSPMHGDGMLRALAFTSCLEPIRSINRRHSSYGMKHVAERLTFSLPGDVIVPPRYVSNGQLIAAAIHAGFRLHAPEWNGDRSGRGSAFGTNRNDRAAVPHEVAVAVTHRDPQRRAPRCTRCSSSGCRSTKSP
jgi:hypothetical protein